MASIEFINKRIEGKEKEIAKLEKKLERIKKAQASNWEDNPYWYNEHDLKSTTRDLDRARKDLEDYRAKLETETHKAASRNIPAIIEFLENWKQRVTEFYLESYERYPEAYEEYRANMELFNLDYYDLKMLEKNDPEAYAEYEETKKRLKESFASAFGHLFPYVDRDYSRDSYGRTWKFDSEKLAKDLNQEANRKYDFIIERTNAIVEEITDASSLSIGDKGDLNGYIIGTKGTAKVQTIGAGGYNIQCFHFRTLIHAVK